MLENNRQSFIYVCVYQPGRDISECFCQLMIGHKAVYEKGDGKMEMEEDRKVATKGHPQFIDVGAKGVWNLGGG